jgi:excisionase family DNA binding protein
MELTIKEFAVRERVTERTVRQWISKGALDVRRTPGGRVRIAIFTVDEPADQIRKNAEECGRADE